MERFLVVGTEPIGLFAAVIGLILGIIFILDGWRGDAHEGAFAERFRVKALAYAVGSFVPAVLVDWGMFKDDPGAVPPAARIPMLVNFSVYFVLTAVAALLAFASLAAFRFRFSDGQSRGYQWVAAFTDFVQYGYGYCGSHYAKLEEGLRQAKLHDIGTAISARNNVAAQAAVRLREAMIDLERPGIAPKIACETILKEICETTADTIGGKPEVNANLMKAVRFDAAPKPTLDKLRLRTTDPEFVLVPVCAIGELALWLPITLPVVSPSFPSSSLPGAPKAFLNRRPLLLNLEKLEAEFETDLPVDVRQELIRYYAQKLKRFKNVLSVPISHGDSEWVGVVNIETTFPAADGAAGGDATFAVHLVSLLSPHLYLLGRATRGLPDAA